ncbi:hypothetical protein Bca4012_005856 [Brassica carinata]
MERRSNSNLKIKQSYSMIKTVQEDFCNNEWSVVAHHPLPSASSYSAKPIANNFKLLNVIELRWRRNEPSPLISPPTKAKSVASRNSRSPH